MKFFIRNVQLRKLVTDGQRVPLNFDSREKAYQWMRRNGLPIYLKIVDVDEMLTDFEKEQLLKVNFQEVG